MSIIDGLVAHYTFDPRYVTSTTVADTSGNGYTGTISGNPTPTIGKIGQGFSFDGNGDYVNVGDVDTNNVTWSFWIKPDLSAITVLLFKSQSYYLQLKTEGEIRLRPYGTSPAALFTGLGMTQDEWSYVTLTWDGTSLKTYQDGALVNTQSLTGSFIQNNDQLYIGYSSGDIAGTPFKGSLDDVRIYSRALSQSEITRLYNWRGSQNMFKGI